MFSLIKKSLSNCPYVNFHVNHRLSLTWLNYDASVIPWKKNLHTWLYIKAKDAKEASEI